MSARSTGCAGTFARERSSIVKSVGLGYAQWGGLPQLLWDADTYYFGVPRDLIERLASRTSWGAVRAPEDLLRQRVRWLVLDPGETSWLKVITTPWTKDGRAVVRAQFGIAEYDHRDPRSDSVDVTE